MTAPKIDPRAARRIAVRRGQYASVEDFLEGKRVGLVADADAGSGALGSLLGRPPATTGNFRVLPAPTLEDLDRRGSK